MKKNNPNIIFFVMDALRAENLGCYGYTKQTSPNIDKLSKKGILFENFFSSNNSTDKSLLAILSGRHILLDDEQDILLTRKELEEFSKTGGKLLQEILKKKGYKTYWLKELYGWQKKSFDYFFEREKFSKKEGIFKKMKNNQKVRDFFRKIVFFLPKKIGDYIKKKQGRDIGKITTEKAIEIIEKSEKNSPFFMWVDYNDTHIPYNPREFTGKFKGNKDGKKFFDIIKKGNYKKEIIEFWKGAFSKNCSFEDIIARYDSAISYNDFLIGKVIDSLEKKGIFKNTIIFFFSDHGESFDSHGIYFSHHGLYDVCTRVPLIIYNNFLQSNKKIYSLAQHEDIVPTILESLNIKYNKYQFDGKSLIPLINEEKKEIRDYIFMEESAFQNKRGIRNHRYKYIEASSKERGICKICNEVHGGIIELYDLERDPKEKENISKKNKNKIVEMKNLLEKHVKETKCLNEKRRINCRLSNFNRQI